MTTHRHDEENININEILESLEGVTYTKVAKTTPVSVDDKRTKLLNELYSQKRMASAPEAKASLYKKDEHGKIIYKKNEDGDYIYQKDADGKDILGADGQKKKIREKTGTNNPRKWWQFNNGKYEFFVQANRRTLSIKPGITAVTAADKDGLIEVIEKMIKLTKAKHFDNEIMIPGPKRGGKSKASASKTEDAKTGDVKAKGKEHKPRAA
jgi:hypothetical protein